MRSRRQPTPSSAAATSKPQCRKPRTGQKSTSSTRTCPPSRGTRWRGCCTASRPKWGPGTRRPGRTWADTTPCTPCTSSSTLDSAARDDRSSSASSPRRTPGGGVRGTSACRTCPSCTSAPRSSASRADCKKTCFWWITREQRSGWRNYHALRTKSERKFSSTLHDPSTPRPGNPSSSSCRFSPLIANNFWRE